MKRALPLTLIILMVTFSVSNVAKALDMNAAGRLALKLCKEIVSCYGTLTLEECLDPSVGLPSTNQIDDEIGLTEGTISSFQDVINGIDDGTYTVVIPAARICGSAISLLTCAELDYGYDPTDPLNFDNLENIFPEDSACSEMLVE